MSMMKWSSPFDEMDLVRKQINDIFAPVAAMTGEGAVYGFTPPVEVIDTEDAYRVRVMLPGLAPDKIGEQVKLEATQKSLTISGEFKQETSTAANEKVLISQFRTGKFFKQLGFPEGIDHEKIHAGYHNGILEVTLPKMLTAQKRSVQIQVK